MKQPSSRRLSSLCGLLVSAACACNSLTGLDDFTVDGNTGAPECTTNQQCSDQATAANAGTPVASVCVQPEGKCVKLLSEDCDTITGDHLDGDPIILGTLFTTAMGNAQRATNLQRQQSAQLAVEEINKATGIPSATTGQNRKLVLVSCDESANLERAARHLVDELHVPGIVGPNTSQDTLDLSTKHTVAGGTVVMTPTGVASSITALIDNDLTYQMVPTDEQRAALMIQQINKIETDIKAARGTSTVKLGVVFRDDALGIGTRSALKDLVLNGKPISDSSNLGKNVLIEGYDFSKPDQAALVTRFADFAPDIVVLAGTAEAITQVMKPLEAGWKADPNRPEYVLIDSVKVPDLTTLVKGNDALRRRVRGTGIKPGAETALVYGEFQLNFGVAFPGTSATTSGMGPSYDAAYSLAYALAATRNEPVSGAAIARGLRRLAGGPTQIEVGITKVTTAFQKLANGEKIKALGTFGPLEWDPNGAVVGGTLEMWCIGAPGGTPAYQSSGLTFDIKTKTATGMYTQCEN